MREWSTSASTKVIRLSEGIGFVYGKKGCDIEYPPFSCRYISIVVVVTTIVVIIIVIIIVILGV